MNLPNFISLARLLSVPLIVWLILQEAWTAAFLVFLAAGISDAVDGYIATRFQMRTDLGSFLDPLADKALLVGIYVTLGVKGELPAWLVILVVSRDMLLIGGTLLSLVMETEVVIRPLFISKLNTVCQIALAVVVLAALGGFALPWVPAWPFIWLVAATTLLSGAGYLVQWARAQGAPEGRGGPH
ncbi:MAG: CDP-alcohol phosphatidyltransferase family protein [Alphaproteobacteria bacterium]|nr:CDP-alcohol phosphatidyltransferase family protein [Alphaproteobacteria bacterium]